MCHSLQIILTLYILILVTGWFVKVSILVWSANDVVQRNQIQGEYGPSPVADSRVS